MPGLDTNRGAKRGRELREELGLDPAAPLACLLSLVEGDLGISVNLTLMAESVEGVCWRLGGEQMLWVHLHEFVPRSRFTLAHELGHIRCGHDDPMIVDTATSMWDTRSALETQANAFAAEFLAPRAGVLPLVAGRPVDLDVVIEIAAHFGVSTLVALYRCTTLGLLPSDRELKARIEADEHLDRWRELAPDTVQDGMTAIDQDELPLLSPRLADGGLGSLLRGEATLEDVAKSAGAHPEALARGLARLGV